MKSALLVVLLAAAATAAVISNEVPDVVRVPDVADVVRVPDADDVADVDVDDIPEVLVTEVDELMDVSGLANETEKLTQTAVETRNNLNQGLIGAKDVRILKSKCKAKGIAGYSHLKILTVNTNRQISAIWVNRVGSSQGATPFIIGGGIGRSCITIGIRSAIGRGYNYKIQVYVR